MTHWKCLFHLASGCLLLTLPAAAEKTPAPQVDQWQLVAGQRSDVTFRPTQGTRTAQAAMPVTFDKQPPHALLFTGDAKRRHRVVVADKFQTAQLPRRGLTVETWVRIDQTSEWGGLVGAIQDNGDYEKGWLLGFRKTQLFFALAGRDTPRLTFLMSDRSFETGYWYHVVGTYDGEEQRLYVDGRLAATSHQQRGDIDYPGQAAFVIGAYQDQDEFYPLKGSIEMVSLRHRAQSAAWIREQFDRRKSLFPDIEAVHPRVTDWPTYLRDNQRTGLAEQTLRFPLELHWRFHNPQAPQPAWPAPANQDFWHKKQRLKARVVYDRANHVVSVGNFVYFGSSADDRVYCLQADTGRVAWTFVTEGPVRFAPTVADGRLLFGSDDGNVYCVDATDGSLQWKVRAAPSDRRIAGNERIISAWPVRTGVLVEDNIAYFCAGLFPTQGVYQLAVDITSGRVLGRGRLSAAAQGYLERRNGKLYVSTGRDPAGAFAASLKRSGKGVGKLVRDIPQQYRYAFVGAGAVRVGGGDGKVAAFRARDGAEIWSAPVDGAAYSLAIVGNTLLVSTDTGDVYAFGPKSGTATAAAAAQPKSATPIPHIRAQVDKSAKTLVQQSALRRGYCLVLNCGDAELVQALAQRTSWQIVGLARNRREASQARARLDAAGIADRAVIHVQADTASLPYTDYLFNLIVDAEALKNNVSARLTDELQRILRPQGGMFVRHTRTAADGWFRRPALERTGDWTHMYANPSNTVCSDDQRVTGPLAIQWFGRPGPQHMLDRHHRTVAPLVANGRLIIPGNDRVIAADVYNGTALWNVAIPNSRRIGAFRDCSYLVATHDLIYVAAGNRCLALNADTGQPVHNFDLPDSALPDQTPDAPPKANAREWGYVAVAGDMLFGSTTPQGAIRRGHSRASIVEGTYWDNRPLVCSDALFAHQRHDNSQPWAYRPPGGLIINATITIGNGRIYFVESQSPATRKTTNGLVRPRDLFASETRIVCLATVSGKPLWTRPCDLSAVEHAIFAGYAEEKLVIVGSGNSGTDKKKAQVQFHLHVFGAQRGEPQWSHTQNQGTTIGGEHGEQDHHPVIVGGRLFCEPFAYDLDSGKPIDNWKWINKHRSGCGTVSASASSLFFRQSHPTMFNLDDNQYARVTTSTRPGCWINMIPAAGLLLVPEASSGCTCNYAIQTSLAFLPMSQPSTPAKPGQRQP